MDLPLLAINFNWLCTMKCLIYDGSHLCESKGGRAQPENVSAHCEIQLEVQEMQSLVIHSPRP
jgi:hypothetical protein